MITLSNAQGEWGMVAILRRIVPRQLVVLVNVLRIFFALWNHTPKKDETLCDGSGQPIPWMTYPFIEFLKELDFADCTVFEFGSGSSTLFWAARAKSVTSVERSLAWFQKMKPLLPTNCSLTHQGNESLYAQEILKGELQYDIIVVDGAVRFSCAQEALKRIKPEGIIILDNTEWYPQTAAMLRDDGFVQIDFSGLGPINAFSSCTSLFFKNPARLMRRRSQKDWHPVGGKFLMAYDDKPFSEIDPRVLVLDGKN